MSKSSYGKGAFVRLIFSSQIAVFVATGLIDKQTMLYKVAASSGDCGIYTLYVIQMLSLVGLFDNLVNDYSRFECKWALSQRHFIYMGMAFCYALLSLYALQLGARGMLPYYLLNVGLLTAGAFYDVKVRYTQLYRERVLG